MGNYTRFKEHLKKTPKCFMFNNKSDQQNL
jgi:hypothetical protein